MCVYIYIYVYTCMINDHSVDVTSTVSTLRAPCLPAMAPTVAMSKVVVDRLRTSVSTLV